MSFDNLCKESKNRVAKIYWSPLHGMEETQVIKSLNYYGRTNYLTYLIALLFFRQWVASLKL